MIERKYPKSKSRTYIAPRGNKEIQMGGWDKWYRNKGQKPEEINIFSTPLTTLAWKP